MKLDRIEGLLFLKLDLGHGQSVTFNPEWVKELRALPLGGYRNYMRDTIYPALEVTELKPGRTTGVVSLRSTVFNQRRELVLEGLQKFLIRQRRPVPPSRE